MRYNLKINDTAREHLREIGRYIAIDGSAEIAKNFVGLIVKRCRDIAAVPGLLDTARPDLARDVRSTPYRSYIVYFRYTQDTLEIVAVLHARRDAIAYFREGNHSI